MIPIDILKQGSQKIVQYMLDLFRSPDADPLFRTKLMVVGYESVGKTIILDCLFPLEGCKNKIEIVLYFADKETQEKWLSRLKRVCMNEATHGIEIQSMDIDNAVTQEYFQKRSERDKGQGKREA